MCKFCENGKPMLTNRHRTREGLKTIVLKITPIGRLSIEVCDEEGVWRNHTRNINYCPYCGRSILGGK